MYDYFLTTSCRRFTIHEDVGLYPPLSIVLGVRRRRTPNSRSMPVDMFHARPGCTLCCESLYEERSECSRTCEDYDEGAADALMGLANGSYWPYLGGPRREW